jgi:hypothetical protein
VKSAARRPKRPVTVHFVREMDGRRECVAVTVLRPLGAGHALVRFPREVGSSIVLDLDCEYADGRVGTLHRTDECRHGGY